MSSKEIPSSESEWKEKLSEDEYYILRERGTEPAGSGEYLDEGREGVYKCVGCGQRLFSSSDKFRSEKWPSFKDVISKDNVLHEEDNRKGMSRTEVLCSGCGGHLGHVFDDGPRPTGKRYCINSTVLEFENHE